MGYNRNCFLIIGIRSWIQQKLVSHNWYQKWNTTEIGFSQLVPEVEYNRNWFLTIATRSGIQQKLVSHNCYQKWNTTEIGFSQLLPEVEYNRNWFLTIATRSGIQQKLLSHNWYQKWDTTEIAFSQLVPEAGYDSVHSLGANRMAPGEDKMARLEEVLRTLNGNQQSVNFTVTSCTNQTFQMFVGGSGGQHDWMEDVCFNSFVADERLVLRDTFPRGKGQIRSQV